ncbi:hypothetical protein G8T60_12035 [Clostridium botulinum C]|uniref:hypothetical protein n=1 Tax=Clostridium botulinum TaxID=1491 RepID=UPI001E57D806|nr:hypothetical protein [Clostridium botulinum]MCD3206789.1 hypothetical protein [Clostridium botulinum C]MCD3209556.1 hypothetical protein [Clostridium botulinum C]MCD3226589.1 hypothetical protein [Clostridium botulinum C]MCD3249022.1 hypothetical protein [Clostridium botulinum C]MCD3257448.1 hypothetical protein [Clostridium botulinum C]
MFKSNKMITAPGEQLSKWQYECICRHLRMFIKKQWDHEKNVPEACTNCSHKCSDDKQILDPWPTFHKLSLLANINEDEMEQLNKQDNVHKNL